jgi:hypothetical protein
MLYARSTETLLSARRRCLIESLEAIQEQPIATILAHSPALVLRAEYVLVPGAVPAIKAGRWPDAIRAVRMALAGGAI